MADLLSVEDYQEAFYIIINALDKISYLQNSYKLTDKNLDIIRISFLDGLQVILAQDLAPKFRSTIEELLLSNVKKSYYLPAKYNLMCLLDDHHVFSTKDKQELIDELISKLSKEENQKNIIMTMIQLSVPVPTLTNKMLQHVNHDKIFLALSDLIELRKYHIVEYFLENEEVNYNLHKIAIGCMVMHQKEDYSALTKTLTTINKSNTPLIILKDVIEHLSAHYLKQEIRHLEKWMQDLPFGLRCSIYAKIGHYESLGKILKQSEDLEWIKVYDSMLIEQGYRELVKELYLHCAMEYLNDHLGSKSYEFMSKLNHRLISISEHKMLNNIQEKLYERFSHRMNMQ